MLVSETGRGKNGVPMVPHFMLRLLRASVTIREMYIWIPKSIIVHDSLTGIDPCNSSFILTVKAAEMTASSKSFDTRDISSVNVAKEEYSLGWTLRFPRAVRIRDDITYLDTATVRGSKFFGRLTL